MDAPSPEVLFAQKLAANEKKTRDRALKKLRKYIYSRSSTDTGFSEQDLIKLWKGLHYCMWMQDKPLLQEDLALQISRLTFSFSNVKAAMLFFKVFLMTEAREWNGIDRLRMDKYFMLVRQMLNQVFVLLKRDDWSQNGIEKFVSTLRESVLDTDSDRVPDSLSMHIADIYLVELAKVGSEQLDSQKVLSFLKVFDHYLQVAKRPLVLKRICVSVYDEIIKQINENAQHDKEEKKKQEEGRREEKPSDEEEDNSDSGYDEDSESKLKFDGELIAEHLFKVGGYEGIRTANRQRIYNLVRRLRESASVAVGQKHEEVSSDEEFVKAVERLEKQHSKKRRKKSKNKADKVEIDGGKQVKCEKRVKQDSESNEVSPVLVAESSTNTKKPKFTSKTKTESTLQKMNNESSLGTNSAKKKKKKNRKRTKTNLSESASEEDNSSFMESSMDKSAKETSFCNNSKESTSQSSLKQPSVRVKDGLSKKRDQSAHQKGTVSYDTVQGSPEVEKSSSSMSQEKESAKTKSKKKKLKRKKAEDCDDVTSSSKKMKSCPLVEQGMSETPQADDIASSSSKKNQAKSDFDEPLQEGEVEIWVPSRKHQAKTKGSGKKSKKTVTQMTTSPFAKFENISSPPPAFVKKAITKTARTPSRKADTSSPSTPELTNSEKKVKFNMKKNMSQKFEDSIHVSPVPAFSPTRTPTQSILKSPLSGEVTPVITKSQKKARKLKCSLKMTPTMGKKQSSAVTRARASDFFS